MLFRYIGDCEKGFVKCFGIRFDKNEPVEVHNEHAISKLRNNSHFEFKEDIEGEYEEIENLEADAEAKAQAEEELRLEAEAEAKADAEAKAQLSKASQNGNKGGNKGQGSKKAGN